MRPRESCQITDPNVSSPLAPFESQINLRTTLVHSIICIRHQGSVSTAALSSKVQACDDEFMMAHLS
jgi:hypothetical protein